MSSSLSSRPIQASTATRRRGPGTPGHLVGETFRLSLGLDLVHVPFNSAGLAVGASVAGHTPICFASPSPAAQQVIEGRLRGLAVTSKTRSQALPDVPTTAEAGYPGIAGDNWQGVVVAGRNAERRSSASSIARSSGSSHLPDVKERLAVLGFEPVASTPEEFARRAKRRVRDMGRGHPGVQHQGAVTSAELTAPPRARRSRARDRR